MTTLTDMTLIHPGTSFTNGQVQRSGSTVNGVVVGIDIYDLPGTNLSRFCGLVISSSVDQEFLYRERELIRRVL